MRLEYDLNVGALYISVSDREVARTRLVDDNTCVDLDADGVTVGVEVIATSSPWPVDTVLHDYRFPPGQAQQIRSYFQPAIPDATPAAEPVTRYEAPTLIVTGAGIAA